MTPGEIERLRAAVADALRVEPSDHRQFQPDHGRDEVRERDVRVQRPAVAIEIRIELVEQVRGDRRAGVERPREVAEVAHGDSPSVAGPGAGTPGAVGRTVGVRGDTPGGDSLAGRVVLDWPRARAEAFRTARALGRALAGLCALALVSGVIGVVLAAWWL